MSVVVETGTNTLVVGSESQAVIANRTMTVIDHARPHISLGRTTEVSVGAPDKIVYVDLKGIQGPQGPAGAGGGVGTPEDLVLNYVNGVLSTVVRESGEQKTLGYDGQGRLSTVADSETGITKTLAYDPSSGLLSTVTISP